MPLKLGKKNIGKNIQELRRSGRSRGQGTAIALDKARESGAKTPKRRGK